MKEPCFGCKVRNYPTCQTSGECAAWMAFREFTAADRAKREAIARTNDDYHAVRSYQHKPGSKFKFQKQVVNKSW